MPKFSNITSWEQAELLMQPAFIRIIDHIRKQLETSTWRESYQDVQIWPQGTAEETKIRVLELREQLSTASPEAADEIRELLTQLPNPYPGYLLCLRLQDREFSFDLWDLCYQVCFSNYSPLIADPANWEVEIDQTLIEADTGDVDWQQLDAKAGRLIAQVFASLPKI